MNDILNRRPEQESLPYDLMRRTYEIDGALSLLESVAKIIDDSYKSSPEFAVLAAAEKIVKDEYDVVRAEQERVITPELVSVSSSDRAFDERRKEREERAKAQVAIAFDSPEIVQPSAQPTAVHDDLFDKPADLPTDERTSQLLQEIRMIAVPTEKLKGLGHDQEVI